MYNDMIRPRNQINYAEYWRGSYLLGDRAAVNTRIIQRLMGWPLSGLPSWGDRSLKHCVAKGFPDAVFLLPSVRYLMLLDPSTFRRRCVVQKLLTFISSVLALVVISSVALSEFLSETACGDSFF